MSFFFLHNSPEICKFEEGWNQSGEMEKKHYILSHKSMLSSDEFPMTPASTNKSIS
jgi:hypothetical protein